MGNAHFLEQKKARTNSRMKPFTDLSCMNCTHYERGGASDGRTTCVCDNFEGQRLGSNLNPLVYEYEKRQLFVIEAWT